MAVSGLWLLAVRVRLGVLHDEGCCLLPGMWLDFLLSISYDPLEGVSIRLSSRIGTDLVGLLGDKPLWPLVRGCTSHPSRTWPGYL